MNILNYLGEVTKEFEGFSYGKAIDFDKLERDDEEIETFIPADYEDEYPLFEVHLKKFPTFDILFTKEGNTVRLYSDNNIGGVLDLLTIVKDLTGNKEEFKFLGIEI